MIDTPLERAPQWPACQCERQGAVRRGPRCPVDRLVVPLAAFLDGGARAVSHPARARTVEGSDSDAPAGVRRQGRGRPSARSEEGRYTLGRVENRPVSSFFMCFSTAPP